MYKNKQDRLTRMDKAIAEAYANNPLLSHKAIAELLGCYRQTVTVALNKPSVKEYANSLCEEQWAEARNKAMKEMYRILEQDNNLKLKYQAAAFILQTNGVSVKQQVEVQTSDTISINISNTDEN